MSIIRTIVTAQGPATTVDRLGPTAQQINDQVSQQIRDAVRSSGENVRISTDRNGVTTIVRSTSPAAPLAPAAPAAPGVVMGHPGDFGEMGIPPQVVDISIAFFIMCAVMVIGWPLARAMGRRLERRGQTSQPDVATAQQLQRIEQAVEAMAIEVERISESQRFMAKLQQGAGDERAALPVGNRR